MKIKNIISLFLILCIILNTTIVNTQDVTETKSSDTIINETADITNLQATNTDRPFRLMVLASGPFTDLGFNSMVNQGRIGVSKYLNITDSDFYNIKSKEDMDLLVEPLVKNNTVDFVICSSLEVKNWCVDISSRYINLSNTQFLIRGSTAATKNAMYVTYNFASINYLSGYFAGLQTKTGNIGFLSPGIAANNNDSFVYAFWVGAKLANPNINFYYYNIGSYYNYDKTVRATKVLIEEYNCDILGDNLDDFTLGTVVIDSGLKALGVNGFNQQHVHGQAIAYGFSYNWTKVFLPFTQRVMNNLDPSKTPIPNSNLYMDFNANPELNFFDLYYSVEINQTVIDKMDEQLVVLKLPRATHPYYCNQYIKDYPGVPYNNATGCISSSSFFWINEPVKGMTYLGLYNISLVEVEVSKSVQYGFSIISGVLILMVLLMILGIAVFNKTPSIRSASPIFLSFILIGGMVVYIGCIVWVSSTSTHQCNARLWLVTLGFTTLIGSLVVKNFRIWLIFDNPELKAIKITNYQLFPWVGGLLAINVLLMAVLTSVGDLRMIEEPGLDGIGTYEFMKVCKMNSQGAATLYTILGYFAALLLVGVFVSWKIRIVDIQEFNESKPIANTLYAISFCLFVIVPLMVAPQDKKSETIVLCVAGLFITTSALFILFIPKFWRIFNIRNGEENSSDFFRTKKASNVATARAESASKGSQGSASKSSAPKANRRGNMIEDFTDDSESSIINQPPVPASKLPPAEPLELTDDSVSDIETDVIENNEYTGNQDINESQPSSQPNSESLSNSINNNQE